MMENRKEIIVEFVDEDISKRLEEEKRKEFLSELESLELEYKVDNIEKYAKYLIEKLEFPITGYYTIDNGLFGEEKVQIEIEEIIEKEPRKGVKCSCKVSKNATRKIPLHLIEVDETAKYKDVINHYKNWYFKNHNK